MSSSARPGSDPTVFTPLEGVVHETHATPAAVADALRRDQAMLQREVILWQRWVRHLALLLFLLVALAFGGMPQEVTLFPVTIVAVAYLACVLLTAWWVKGQPEGVLSPMLPGLLVSADIVATAAFFYFASSPAAHYRMLLICVLAVQLAVFYFGWRLGVYATLLAVVAYASIDIALPPFVSGVQPSYGPTVLNVAVFLIVSAVLLQVFGSFRTRMNQVRVFCKLIEGGEFAGALAFIRESRPDDVTLLARSFDAMRNRLAEQLGTDPLTGCLNRRALEIRLRSDWRLAMRRGSHVAVLALDLDHFKKINDVHGHPGGDLVLEQLAGIMKATARDTDAVARFGGDEFVIVLPDTAWQGALTFAERLRRKVDDFKFGPAHSPVSITISVGVVVARASDPIAPEALLQEADRALYKAKTGGRNRVVS